MKSRPDDKAILAAAEPLRGSGCPGRRVRMHRVHAHAVRGEEIFVNICGAQRKAVTTYVSLLLKHVPDLEPNVRVCERARRIAQDAVETLETVGVFALLLVDDTEAEQYLVRLVKV